MSSSKDTVQPYEVVAKELPGLYELALFSQFSFSSFSLVLSSAFLF